MITQEAQQLTARQWARMTGPYIGFSTGCFALGVSSMSILGHIFAVAAFYNWRGVASMALPTAVMGLLLSVGLISLSITVIEHRDLAMPIGTFRRGVATSGLWGAIGFIVALAILWLPFANARSAAELDRADAAAQRAENEILHGRMLNALRHQRGNIENQQVRAMDEHAMLIALKGVIDK